MGESVIKEYSYKSTPEKLWKALTVKEQMKLWYFDIEEFKPEIGFEFRFWGGTETRQYLHICKITEVVFGKKLCHTWSYDGIPGETNLCFEIEQTGKETTNLKLSHSGFETFPKDNPDLAAKNFDEGWTYILGTSLKNYIEGKS
ncbi:MAG TPA: SRPBCC domain-containing protein [Draconibacterium sp.]|nr:SRPBCC domain-containing protein [Draconibacterium sp.]